MKAAETGLVLPDYLPARMVNEYVYCPRLFFYEWVEGVFAASADTVGGSLRHEKISRGGESLPEEAAADETIHARSIELSSDAAGLIARIDLVELVGSRAVPVEYKSGAPRATDAGPEPWPADVAQLAVQALVLRDNGYACDEGVLYYHATKQRVRVAIDDALLAATRAAAAEARAVARSGRIPPPLVDSPKCPRCSLVGICLPDETRLGAGLADPAGGQLRLFGDVGDAPPADSVFVTGDADGAGLVGDGDDRIRRLVPARDDLRPLYVLGQGLAVGKSGNVLQVRERGMVVQEARIGEVSQVNLFGNVQLTTQALQTLCQADKDIGYFSQGAWFYGMTRGMGLKNVFLRVAQFRRAAEAGFALGLARTWVASKIRNQRTLLQRNHAEPPRPVLEQMRRLALQAAEAEDLPSLLGTEGTAARLYFGSFAGMIKAGEDGDDVEFLAAGAAPAPLAFDFRGRNRRPPRDPVNALLSFAYALLAKDLTVTCHAVGFDPFVGYFHQPRFGRPALALDLMEEFRPLVADSAVLTAINTRMVGEGDFVRAGGAVALGTKGRGKFIRAYEQRMDALVTHPLFGYRVSYRRVLEIQARLLARVLTGEMRQYVGFETR